VLRARWSESCFNGGSGEKTRRPFEMWGPVGWSVASPKELRMVRTSHNSGQPQTPTEEHQFQQLRKLITIRNSPERSRVESIFSGSLSLRLGTWF
jgi:hypothetical protein